MNVIVRHAGVKPAPDESYALISYANGVKTLVVLLIVKKVGAVSVT